MSYTRKPVKRSEVLAYGARMSPADWSWSWEALAPLLLAAVYLVGARNERHALRTASFLGGCMLLVAALVTPLDTVAREYLVWAHLLQNVVLAEWAPLLLVLGVPPGLAAVGSGQRVIRALTLPCRAPALGPDVRGLARPGPVRRGTPPPVEPPGARARVLRPGRGPLLVVRLAGRTARLASGARAAYVFAAFVLSAPLGLVLALVPEPL